MHERVNRAPESETARFSLHERDEQAAQSHPRYVWIDSHGLHDDGVYDSTISCLKDIRQRQDNPHEAPFPLGKQNELRPDEGQQRAVLVQELSFRNRAVEKISAEASRGQPENPSQLGIRLGRIERANADPFSRESGGDVGRAWVFRVQIVSHG